MAVGLAFGQPFTGTATLVNMPGWYKRAWRGWRRGYAAYLRTLVSTTQATIIYVSNDGNDSTGDGSSGNPYATIAKAQSLIGAGKEIRIRYGDLYKESNAFTFSVDGVVARAYAFGGRTARDGVPIISKFQADYSAGGWTLDAGATYRYKRTDLNAANIGWVREKNCINQANVYRKVASTAEVESNAGTWYATGTTVYIHPHDDRNPSSDGRIYESVLKNTINGCLVTGDNIYLRELRFDGWGCDPTTSNAYYGIQVSTAGATKKIWVDRCEAYYNGRHNLGLTSAGDGCQIIWDHCKAGWCTPAGDNPIVDYSANGGHSCMWEEPVIVAGNLPVGANTWSTYGSGVPAWVSHCGSGTVAFTCVYKPKIIDGTYAVGWVGSCQSAPTCTADLALARAFVVEAQLRLRDHATYLEGSKLPWSNSVGLTFLQEGDTNQVYINCHFDMRCLGMVGGPANGSALSNSLKGFFVNCVFDGSFSGVDSAVGSAGGYRCWFWNGVSLELAKLWNCWINLRPRGPVHTGIEGQCVSNNNVTFCSPNLKFRNCVFTAQLDAGADFYLGLNNNRDAAGVLQTGDARSLLNNAYGCNAGKTDTYRGYDQDPYLVEIPTSMAIGQYDGNSPLVSTHQQQLTGGYDLEYDMNWNPRNVASTPIGPWEIADGVW